ncbi:BPSS1780 family membrane protein [Piscinibacter sp.]|jgi:hypothetical protein|uniref:BPSS1780 family membrane protein n=1 Tax=Piscinibacter sp. TaxID=1903157 RepID=UPI002F41173B
MKLQLASAREGALWVRSAFRIFFRRPVAFCALFVVYMVAAQLLALLWPVGPVAALMMMPLASLGFMIATRTALEGRFPLPAVFIEPLRSGPRKLRGQLLLGFAYAVAVAATLWLSHAVGGSAFEAIAEALRTGKTSPQSLEPLLQDPSLQAGLYLFLGLVALISVPFWHAPALVHWGDQDWTKAMFFSTMACWRNKGAFAVYTLTWLAVILLFALVSDAVFTLFGAPQMVLLAAAPAALMFSTAFYASLYFTFIGCFETSTGELAPPI